MAQQKKDRDPFQTERQTNARAALRVLLALYLAYIIYKLVRGRLSGDLDIGLPLYYTALVIFVAAELAIAAFTVKRWRAGRKAVDEAWERARETPSEDAPSAPVPEDPETPADPEDGP